MQITIPTSFNDLLLYYFSLHLVFYFIEIYVLKCLFQNQRLFLDDNIFLNYNIKNILYKVPTTLIEYFLLCRYSFFGYKNNVKGNLRLFSSLFMSINVVIVYFFIMSIFKNDLQMNLNTFIQESVNKFFVLWFGIFVIERKSLYDKWMYLAALYNKLIELESKIAIDASVKAEKPYHEWLEENSDLEDDLDDGYDNFRDALCIDILDMEMWSHPSFRSIFLNRFKVKHHQKYDKNLEQLYYLKTRVREVLR